MAKAPKSSPQNKSDSRSTPSATETSMSGIQKVAWWSVPAVGFVAVACATTLGVLFATQPPASSPQALSQKAVQPQAAAAVAKKPEASTPKEPVKAPKQEPSPVSAALAVSQPVLNTKPTPKAEQPAPTPKDAHSTSNSEPTTSEAVVESTSAATGQVMLLDCSDGKLVFAGQQDLVFVDAKPDLEISEQNGIKFGSLSFNGVDQSIELPDIPKDAGTAEIVVKMPEWKTSIFLDSNYQRLTLRKNKDGLRWRVEAQKKMAKIRDSATPIDFAKWHHIALTWNPTDGAILYVDGVEHDRTSYVNEQPQFPSYKKVVLGKTRGPNARYYPIRINRFTVYEKSLPADKIAAMNTELRQKYPFMFE